MWSMTKLVTSLACLQLKERGLVDYDDAALCERLIPELCAQPVLLGYDGDTPQYAPRTEAITLRRLLTHTVGQAYGNRAQLRWEAENIPVRWTAPGATTASFATPLNIQPGSSFVYGLGIDWAGILLERVTGQTLDEYFQEHIFGPLGIRSMSFFPTPELKARLMQMCTRTREGTLVHTQKLRPVSKMVPEDIVQQAGGGGLLGTAREYLTFLQAVLRCKDADGLISRAGFRELFTDSLPPDGEGDCHAALGAFLKFRGYPEEQYTSGRAVGYSPGLCLNLGNSVNGRKAGSGFWFGAARSEYWIDPASGLIVSPKKKELTAGAVRDAADERPREDLGGRVLVLRADSV
jgi:CubicO group peptidase (beta-lactamase class C family)